MLKIFSIMLIAIVVGFFFRNVRRMPRKLLSTMVSGVILLLMFAIGVEIGGSPSVLAVMGELMIDMVVISVGALGGTILAAWTLNKYLLHERIHVSKGVDKGAKSSGGHGFSLLILGTFFTGGLLGYGEYLPRELGDWTMWALYALVILVGFNLGSDSETLSRLKGQSWKIILVPVATIVGTLLGVSLLVPFTSLSLTQQLAVGSGFGYYSLSSVLLSELQGAQIGALALLVNVVRELATVAFAPIIARRFSPVALICCGGATTLDVTLPVIVSNCGGRFVGMSVVQGMLVDFSVPILVSLFGAM